jgi:hypothetical protein
MALYDLRANPPKKPQSAAEMRAVLKAMGKSKMKPKVK